MPGATRATTSTSTVSDVIADATTSRSSGNVSTSQRTICAGSPCAANSRSSASRSSSVWIVMGSPQKREGWSSADSGGVGADAVREVTEALAWFAIGLPLVEQRAEHTGEVGDLDALLHESAEAGA